MFLWDWFTNILNFLGKCNSFTGLPAFVIFNTANCWLQFRVWIMFLLSVVEFWTMWQKQQYGTVSGREHWTETLECIGSLIVGGILQPVAVTVTAGHGE